MILPHKIRYIISLTLITLISIGCGRGNNKEYRLVATKMHKFYTGEEKNLPLLDIIYNYEKHNGDVDYSNFKDWKLRSLEQWGSDGVNPIIHIYLPLKAKLDSIGINTFDDFLYDLGYPPYLKEWYNKKDDALHMGKTYKTYCKTTSKCMNNENYIKNKLSNSKGIVTSIGWKSKVVGEGIYLVTYSYKENNEIFIYALEVNIPIESVRNIFDNDILTKKYWNINNKYVKSFVNQTSSE